MHQRLLCIAFLSRFGAPYPGNVKVIAKRSVGRVPIFGWILRLADFVFLARSWTSDRHSFIARLRSLANYRAQTGCPLALVLFPEGTRISDDKMNISHAYAKENNLPLYSRVLLPRTRGFRELVPLLREHLDIVADVTFMFDPDFPSIVDVIAGYSDVVVHTHTTVYPMRDLPSQPEELDQWLMQRWHEKEARILNFEADAASLGPPSHHNEHRPPSFLPLILLFAVFVATIVVIVHFIGRVHNGVRYLVMAMSIIALTALIAIINDLIPRRRFKGETDNPSQYVETAR